jgi:hypothetical protein
VHFRIGTLDSSPVFPRHERSLSPCAVRACGISAALVPRFLVFGLAFLLSGLAGCKVADAKIYNLSELHDGESHHRYNAALEGDFEYIIRHELLGLFQTAGKDLAAKSDSRVDAPADECLENLIELEEIDSGNPVTAGRQVQWFARLAVEDPWHLSRERAVLALTAAGSRLGAGLPSALGSDQKAADADLVVSTLTPLVKTLHAVLDKTATRADLEQACAAVRALDLDMSGARRALEFVVTLQQTAGTRSPDVAPLAELSLDLQRVCVRRALATAIDDKDPLVRAAALRGAHRRPARDRHGPLRSAEARDRARGARRDPRHAGRIRTAARRGRAGRAHARRVACGDLRTVDQAT